MKLQACTQCGAQFDVSGFQPGQSFSCGACGTVLKAGEAVAAAVTAGRKPGTARTSAPTAARGGTGRAPAAPPAQSPGKGGRQYTPVDRSGKAKVAKPRRGARAAAPADASRSRSRRGEDGEGPAGRKGGVSPAVLGGILGVVLLGVLGLVMFGGGGDKPAGGGASAGTSAAGPQAPSAPPAPTETAKEVMGDYGTNPPTTKKQWLSFISRLEALGEDADAKNGLRTVYTAYVRGLDGKADPKAHRFLGHREFALSKDDEATFMDIARVDLDFMRGVEAARSKRWFTEEENDEWEIAQKALGEMREYMHRMETDREFRAGIAIRGNLANHEYFKTYNFVGHWASPFLICYSSSDRLSEYDLLSIEDPVERKARREELAVKRQQYERVVAEKGHMVQQLYAQFVKVFGEPLGLKPLMDEYGGRPDYPIGVRSYGDGCPMVMWVFDNKASWDDFHQKVSKELIPHFAAGYFSGESEMVMLYDEGEDTRERVFEIGKTVHEGVHQLEHFFARQKNNWRKPPFSQDFLGEGLAEWLGSVKMNAKYELEFVGVNVTRCGEAQRVAQQLKAAGKEYPVFPLEFLTSVTNYAMARGYAASEWGLDENLGMSLFYEQSWGFVYFLNTFENGRYWPRFVKFVDLIMQRPKLDNSVQPYFRQAFDITGEEDWEDLDDEFKTFMKGLLTLNLREFEYTPPPRKR